MVIAEGCCMMCCCQVTGTASKCTGPLRLRLSHANVLEKEHQVIFLTTIIIVK